MDRSRSGPGDTRGATSRHGRTRVHLSSPIVLIVIVTASLVVAAMVAALPVTPGPPVNGRADAFVRPFVYQVPGDSKITLDAKSDRLQVLATRQAGRHLDLGG